MESTSIALILLLAVVVSGFVARVTHLPAPLVQLALGAAIYWAGMSSAVLDPELFFLLFLPPLLFLDGWRLPNDALARDAATLLKLALGLVLFTVLGMGLFIHWLLPVMPLAVAFALAAVIAPTDPIAVSAIARRSPVPRRLMHILQGEALLNDASGLVCLRFAVAAALTGSFSLGSALASFAGLAAGGLAIGAGATWLVARLASRATAQAGQDGGAQILVTLLIPFGVYLLAERLHCSGILAAVAAGVTMSVTDAWPWRATTRLRRAAVWDTVQLAANGTIFVLLGEQLPALLADAPATVQTTGHQNPWWLAGYALVILAALCALRFGWVWMSLRSAARRSATLAVRAAAKPATSPATGAPTPEAPAPAPAPLLHNWRVVMVTTLAGVRGAVTLAGVMTLPLALSPGVTFPARDLAVLLAAGVIVLSIVLASIALPGLLRQLDWPAEPLPPAVDGDTRRAGAEAALRAIQAAPAQGGASAEVAARLVQGYRDRLARHAAAGPAQRHAHRDIEHRLRLVGLRAERAEVLRYGRSHGVDELALRRIIRELDFEEARYSD